MSLPLQLEVGVSSTHGFVGVRVLFEQRFAELSAALNGYGDHDVGDRASELSSRVVIAKTRAPRSAARRARCSDTGVSPDADSISRQSVSSTSLSWSTSLSVLVISS